MSSGSSVILLISSMMERLSSCVGSTLDIDIGLVADEKRDRTLVVTSPRDEDVSRESKGLS